MAIEKATSMESTETVIRTIAAVLAVLLAGFLPAGCQTSPGSREDSQHYSEMDETEQASFLMQRRFGLGQSNAVVQSDARKAAEALERADLETCDQPDAESYREAAREAAGAVESVALESSGIVESVQAATETAEYGGRLVAQAEDRVGQSWRAFKEAQRELRSLAFNDFDRMQPMSVGQVWEKAETQFNLVRDVTRDLLTVGDDLRMEMGREQWGEIVALVDSRPDPDVDSNATPDVDPNAILESLFDEAGAANSQWIALEDVEVSLPTDRSTRVEQMGYSQREALEDHVAALNDAGGKVDDARGQLDRLISYIETTRWRLDQLMVQGSERTAEIAQQTGPLAAEATRNAWLAVEACGGEVPPEHLGLLENPFDDYTTIPQWNSTFWDISSP